LAAHATSADLNLIWLIVSHQGGGSAIIEYKVSHLV
jgi:hypothetical protein